MSSLNRSEQVASYLLEIGAVALRPQEPLHGPLVSNRRSIATIV